MKKLLLLSISLFTITAINACSPVVAQRGNMLEDYQIEQVSPGTATRSQVLQALGSPTTKSTFDESVWYYIGQETEKRGILDPEVVKERIFLVAFNDEGTLEALQEVDRERINIPYERSKTPTYGNETTVMQELLGNLGKFNPPAQSAANGGN